MKKKFNEEEDLNPKDNELDELDTDDDARAVFIIKAMNDAKPGSYQIPYSIIFFQLLQQS